MAKALPTEYGQRGCNTVQQPLEVDVDHLLPILNAQVLQLGNRTDTCIADEHVELAISTACQRGERGYILAFRHVRASVDRVAAGTFNLAHQSFQLVSSSRSEHDFCASSG